MKNFNISVCVMHPNKSWEYLYEHIPTWEEADLLAQFAMACRTDMSDLIFVWPGNNRDIVKDPEQWRRAAILAQQYVTERRSRL